MEDYDARVKREMSIIESSLIPRAATVTELAAIHNQLLSYRANEVIESLLWRAFELGAEDGRASERRRQEYADDDEIPF